jgi:hypothetical protein
MNSTTYAIKTPLGYVATQGGTSWLQDTPDGWAAHPTRESAEAVADETPGATVEAIPAPVAHWSHKQQPDWDRINAALETYGVRINVPETGSSDFHAFVEPTEVETRH